MGDVRVNAKAVAAKALRAAGCSPEEADRLSGAFVAVAEAVRDDVVSQIAQAAVVRPGDTLVVRMATQTAPEQASFARESLRSKLPGVEVVVVGSDEEMAVYRSEPPRIEVTVDADVSSDQVARFAREMERRMGSSGTWSLR